MVRLKYIFGGDRGNAALQKSKKRWLQLQNQIYNFLLLLLYIIQHQKYVLPGSEKRRNKKALIYGKKRTIKQNTNHIKKANTL